MPLKAKAAIGLSIAVELVRRRLATVTPDNRFKIPRAAAPRIMKETHDAYKDRRGH